MAKSDPRLRRLFRVGGSGVLLTVLSTAGFFVLVESSLDALSRITIFALATILVFSFSHYVLRARLAKLRRELVDQRREFKKRLATVEKQLRTDIPADTHSVSSAISWLSSAIRPAVPIPFSHGWAASPEFLAELYERIRSNRPSFVLDLGSGLSTLIAGYAVKANGVGTVQSWDHLEEYAEKSRALIQAHQLHDVVEIIHKPLVPVELSGEQFPWYDDTPDVRQAIDVLIVDGPPASTGKNARYPAIALLKRNLSPTATILLDDVERVDEREILQLWMAELQTASVRTFARREAKQFAVLTCESKN